MSDITSLKRALVTRVLEGSGEASPQMRRSAFDNTELSEPMRTLVDKVARHANTVTDEDFAAARAAGLSEDQIYEVVVCAAIGQASRQYESALAALEAAAGRK
jgi:alkylhydroperoxidase family enzyme